MKGNNTPGRSRPPERRRWPAAALAAIILAVGPGGALARGAEVPAMPESRMLGSEELLRDAEGNPRLDLLPFVHPPLEAPPEVQARLAALEKETEAETEEEAEPLSLPAVPELPADPLLPPRMDAGDPNPDGINASKLELIGQGWEQ